ncbi:hypothetical protein [Robbsia andropogonis]|uniref:hypothetical protein n=1 Tax=Robbsia andropogonis TaxID=28092 RepID=UPI0020A084D7|nr:hypothetical protein [Robbsia andropogonis]MCP1120508.1 hypothetical protein [Robbsia andropogonis]MCP1131289.1 hypothetical protein [Robbsia andropogonis]
MQVNLNDLMAAYASLARPTGYYATALRHLIGEREATLRTEITRLAVEAATRQHWTPEHRDRVLHFAEHGAAADLEATSRYLAGLVH